MDQHQSPACSQSAQDQSRSVCLKEGKKKALFHSNKKSIHSKKNKLEPLEIFNPGECSNVPKRQINREVSGGKTLSALIWVKSSRGLHSCVYLSQSVGGFNLAFSSLLLFPSWKNPGKGIKRRHLEFASCISCSLKYMQTWSRAKIWMRRLHPPRLNMSVSRSLDSCFKTFKIYRSIFYFFWQALLIFLPPLFGPVSAEGCPSCLMVPRSWHLTCGGPSTLVGKLTCRGPKLGRFLLQNITKLVQYFSVVDKVK